MSAATALPSRMRAVMAVLILPDGPAAPSAHPGRALIFTMTAGPVKSERGWSAPPAGRGSARSGPASDTRWARSATTRPPSAPGAPSPPGTPSAFAPSGRPATRPARTSWAGRHPRTRPGTVVALPWAACPALAAGDDRGPGARRRRDRIRRGRPPAWPSPAQPGQCPGRCPAHRVHLPHRPDQRRRPWPPAGTSPGKRPAAPGRGTSQAAASRVTCGYIIGPISGAALANGTYKTLKGVRCAAPGTAQPGVGGSRPGTSSICVGMQVQAWHPASQFGVRHRCYPGLA